MLLAGVIIHHEWTYEGVDCPTHPWGTRDGASAVTMNNTMWVSWRSMWCRRR